MTDQPGSGDRPASYSEKYRGTEWGRPEPPVPASSSGGRGPRLVALVVVLAIAASGVGLAALGLSPSHPPTGPSSSPSAGIGTVDQPVATPSPRPTPDPGKAVLAKFWTAVDKPDLSYHMTIKGTSRLDRNKIVPVSEALDVVGDTYAGTVTIPQGSARLARKDGVDWFKGKGARIGVQTSIRNFRQTPFLCLRTPMWLDYVKPVTVNGRNLHLLRSNRRYLPDIPRMALLRRFQVEPDTMTLDVYVTDDGVPVSASFNVAVEIRDSTGQHAFKARTDYAFSRVGDTFTIVIPKH